VGIRRNKVTDLPATGDTAENAQVAAGLTKDAGEMGACFLAARDSVAQIG
jgi:hypothetical protein